MSKLTAQAINQISQGIIDLKYLIEVDGAADVYGATSIKRRVLIGDTLTIGEFIIGGFENLPNQEDILSVESSSSTFKTSLQPDKGRSSSTSSVKARLVDIGGVATKLITPGLVVDNILFRKCKIWVGFGDDLAFPEDYIVVHKGYINNTIAGQGYVDIEISDTDSKKRQALFPKVDTALKIGIDASQTTIELDSAESMIEVPITPGAGNLRDSTLKTYIVIEDEIIEYETIGAPNGGPNGGTQLFNCVRGQFFTSAVSHALDAEVQTYYKLEGNAIDIALKLMLSDQSTSNYLEAVPTNVNVISTTERIDNIYYFQNQNLIQIYNIQPGDFIKTSGFLDAENNLAEFTEILDVVLIDSGSYLLIKTADILGNPVFLKDKTDSGGTIEFFSKYNTLGEGLRMIPDDVDVGEHELIKLRFLSSAEHRFFFDDTQDNLKEFIQEQVYFPFGAYEVIKNSKSSLSYTIGPIPGDNIQVLDITNIKNPDNLTTQRSSNKFLYNRIVYKYDKSEAPQSDEKYFSGVVAANLDSFGKYKEFKDLIITSEGMRSNLSARVQAQIAAVRMLNRYNQGAQFIKDVAILLEVGVQVEVGDIVLLDPAGLNLINISDGTRISTQSFYEITNRSFNVKTGDIKIDLLNTNSDTDARYGLISPSSQISKGISTTEFQIKPSYSKRFGENEFKKWESLVSLTEKPRVRITSFDYTTRNASSRIESISRNTIKLIDPLPFTPQVDDILNIDLYADDQTDRVKLLYVHMQNDPTFSDGTDQYKMI